MRWASLRARAALIGLVGSGILLLPSTAFSQEQKGPVIDSAPGQVEFGANALIKGHMEPSDGDERVTLQKKKGDDVWADLTTQGVDGDGSVRFERNDMRESSTYRLAWVDPQGREQTSEAVHIQVAARVVLRASRRHLLRGAEVTLSGTLQPDVQGRDIVLQRRREGEWRTLQRRPVRAGRFRFTYRPKRIGLTPVRAVFGGDETNSADRDRSYFKVYERDRATWYGPGFYGDRTACGQRLRRGTLGVAHRELPCGTRVSLLHKGRTITVPVIDRGPYGGANWDLTEETAERLRFRGTRTIGVAR